jgi:PAS domain S-box-containing protein
MIKAGDQLSRADWSDLWGELLRQLPEGIALLEDGLICEVNPAFLQLGGYALGDVQGRSLDSLLEAAPDPDGNDTGILLPHGKESGAPTAVCFRTKSGRRLPVQILPEFGQARGQGRQPVVVRDLSERQAMARERLKTRQLASLAALSGGIAHDYNNLLTAIMGNISLVMTYLDPEDHLHALLNQAQEASLIAKELTNRLITFSRGGAPLKQIVRLAPLIEGAVEFALSGSSVTVDFSIPDDAWCVAVDHAQMTQALHHLVINARESMPQGGLIQVEVANIEAPPAARTPEGGATVRIDIRDEGQGIPPEIQERIFDPYFSTKTKGDQKGLGLGLSIAESIVKRHGGSICVTSRVGHGSCFRIDLPAAHGEAAPLGTSQPSAAPAMLPRSGTVLVMDDESMIRELAANLLQRLGYAAEAARDGEEALALYAKALEDGHPYDAVILDLTVRGGMGGKETIRGLRAMDPQVRAIVSSGYADDPGVTSYRDYGFCGVVAKPYRIQELAQKLAEVIR